MMSVILYPSLRVLRRQSTLIGCKFKRKVLQAAEHRVPAGSAGRSPV